MAFVLVMQVIFYRPPSFQQLHRGTRTKMGELKRVDFAGCFLIVAGLVLLLLGVSWGGCKTHLILLATWLAKWIRRSTSTVGITHNNRPHRQWRLRVHHLCFLG